MFSHPLAQFKDMKAVRQASLLVQWLEPMAALNIMTDEQGQLLKKYIQVLQPEIMLKRESFWLSLPQRLDQGLNQRQLLDIVVLLERFLNQSARDEDIFLASHQDQSAETKRDVLPIYFVLDHLRSAFNVGSLFRTADCLGVKHIYLVGYTPTPEDSQVQKTSMQSCNWISWSQHSNIEEVQTILKSNQVMQVGLETSAKAQKLDEAKWNGPTALFVGNERFGLDPSILSQMDRLIYVPMRGHKNSMNVANLLSLVTYQVGLSLELAPND
jgi:23S rRNA (guanosine2251-2'-O)-methyltransferase